MLPVNENGMGLIEVIISTALGAAIIAGTAKLYQNISTIDTKNTWKQKTIDAVDQVANIIDRDANMRSSSADIQVIAGGKGVTIKRFKKGRNINNYDQTYQVSFKTECQTPNNQMKDRVRSLNALIRQKANALGYVCLQQRNCSYDKYSEIRVTTSHTGDGIPVYPITRFPDMKSSQVNYSQGLYAMALCAKKNGNQMEIRLEGFAFSGAAKDLSNIITHHKSWKVNLFRNSQFSILPN